MRRKTKATKWMAYATAALVGGACTGGGKGVGDGAAGGKPSKRGGNASQVLGGTDAGVGGTLRLASIQGPDYMDPAAAYTVTFFSYVGRGVFRKLVDHAPGPDFAKQSQLVPDLAEDLGQPNTDYTEWTYKLKDGVKFGPALGGEKVPGVTGEEITSPDIKYAIERLFLPSVGAGYGFYYEPIEGAIEFQEGRADDITGIETPDDKTIVFKLTKPIGDWDYRMSMAATTPAPEKYVSQFDGKKISDYDNHVVSSGPYYVDTYSPSEEIRLLRNREWDPDTDDIREAFVDGVDWRMGFDNADCVDKVLSNDYDNAVDCEPKGPQLKEIITDPELKDRFFNFPIACTNYMFMNTTVEPFDDPKVREAMNYAVDRANQLKLLGGSSTGDVATSILPPGMIGHLPTTEYNPFESPGMSGDIQKAKALLAEAGLADGYHEKLLLVGDAEPEGRKQIESLRSDLEAIGFDNLEIRNPNFPDNYTQYYGVPRTNTAMGFAAWCKDYPSPVTFLEPLLYGPNIIQQGNGNYAEIDDPELNKAIEDSVAIPLDSEEAVGSWESANKLATEKAPWVPLRWYLDRELGGTDLVNGYWHQQLFALDWVNTGIKS